jgi:CRP-like cAMP-binding protein
MQNPPIRHLPRKLILLNVGVSSACHRWNDLEEWAMSSRSERGKPHLSISPFCDGTDRQHASLTAHQQQLLAASATRLSFGKGTVIYRAGDPLAAIYDLDDGVVKTCSALPDGRLRVSGFLSSGDLFGLADNGHYVHTVIAVTAVHLYKIPLLNFVELLSADLSFDLCFLLKLCDELRETERHALILGRNDALGRVAMFVATLKRERWGNRPSGHSLYLPMSRADIASYVGITQESASRAFNMLEKTNVITFADRRHFTITDETALQYLVAGAKKVRTDTEDA